MVNYSTTEAAGRTLRELGIEVWGELAEGDQVTLARGHSQQVYRVTIVSQEVSTVARAHDLLIAQDIAEVPDSARRLLILDYASTPLVTAIERTRVDYVDAAGNAGIEFGDVFVRIRGKRAPAAMTPYRERSLAAYNRTRPTNLFSPIRSKVVFALLAWPQLMSATIREISDAAGTSQGSAHLTIEILRDLEHTIKTPHGTRWRNWSRTADAWLSTYPATLGRSLLLATLSGDIDHPRKVSVDDAIFLSGESAFSPNQETRLAYVDQLIRPTTLTLYVESYDPHLAIENRWRSDGLPNIFVRQKFWRSPDHADAPLAGFRSAPPLLVIADLLATNEPRQMEAARELLDIEHDRHS